MSFFWNKLSNIIHTKFYLFKKANKDKDRNKMEIYTKKSAILHYNEYMNSLSKMRTKPIMIK